VVAPLNIGVLALQGDFEAHARSLARQGANVREIRRPSEVEQVDGLVLPGGETTTMIKLMRENGLWDAVATAPAAGRPVFGTCAGLILLAREVTHPPQPSLDLLPVTVERNAYGRQVDSFVAPGEVRVPEDLARADGLGPVGVPRPTEFVFIRAPRITALHGPVEVLAQHDGAPVLVRDGRVLGGSFHPELARDGFVTRLFLALVAQARSGRLRGNGGRGNGDP
jgi:pyridoxal 5'-phosphate synthase pdxT subunit